MDRVQPDLFTKAGFKKSWERESFANWIKAFDRALERKNGLDDLSVLLFALRDRFMERRGRRLGAYLAPSKDAPLFSPENPNAADLGKLARYFAARSPSDDIFARPLAGVVFTAHPTFCLSEAATSRIIDIAGGRQATDARPLATHRRGAPPLLEEENAQSLAALTRGRAALDEAAKRLVTALRQQRKTDADPHLMTLASWVGFDTDGRNDISCWTAFRFRILLKRAQLAYIGDGLARLGLPRDNDLNNRLARALAALDRQESALAGLICKEPTPEDVQAFCDVFFAEKARALVNFDELAPLWDKARERLSAIDARDGFDALRANAATHGLGLGHVHFRLNAAQIHNVVRARIGLTDDPAVPLQRAGLIKKIETPLKRPDRLSVNFGTLLYEPSAAARLMMVVAQILKHIDQGAPIRFLIAETEFGYTLLATLWLARIFGVDEGKLEISPLFETESALENGSEILEEAFSSAEWRDYVKKSGKLCLQFGHSDSGRYIGQLCTSVFIQRIKCRAGELLRRHGLTDVELVFFDTHGESIGRGAHPSSLEKRLRYFSSDAFAPEPADEFTSRVKLETSFQGGDGFLHFGSERLAENAIGTILLHGWRQNRRLAADNMAAHKKTDASAHIPEFFAATSHAMRGLLKDAGYGKLLGSFGFGLLDKTGSRPSARQAEGILLTRPQNPAQMRAIPNNAILLQLGWWANILHGLGAATERHPELIDHFHDAAHPCGLLADFINHAAAHSDIDVLRAAATLLDPGSWLDEAGEARGTARAGDLTIAQELEKLEFWRSVPALFRTLQRDHLALVRNWPDLPRMDIDEKLIFAIRFALIRHLWRIVAKIPYFGPRESLNREAVIRLVLSLEVPRALELLRHLFPLYGADASRLDFGEAGGGESAQGFEKENREIFAPMERTFELIRECSLALIHANGCLG